MPRIVSVGTAVPEYAVSQARVRDLAAELFGSALPDIDRLLPAFAHTGIERRHFCVPLDWFRERHSFEEKNQLYVEHACRICETAVLRCLHAVDLPPQAVDAVLFVSTTGLATPSIDARLVNRLGFQQGLQRTPIWGLGCVGGAVGLSRAFQIASAWPSARVLLVAAELCGLTFQREDFSKSNLIAAALFADGAAAALIAGDECSLSRDAVQGVSILACASTTWPDTLDVMGWRISDAGFGVLFSRDIPSIVRRCMRQDMAAFLEPLGLTLRDVSRFVCHPGGPKVLEAYAESLDIPAQRLEPARRVMRDYGNMSSPTVLFVLREVMLERPQAGEYGLVSALGPGFSSERLLLQW